MMSEHDVLKGMNKDAVQERLGHYRCATWEGTPTGPQNNEIWYYNGPQEQYLLQFHELTSHLFVPYAWDRGFQVLFDENGKVSGIQQPPILGQGLIELVDFGACE
jgi:hypothetical protein